MWLCTGAMRSTTTLCLQHACNEMPLDLKHHLLCSKYKPHLLAFPTHPAKSVIEDCWQECFPDSANFCSFNVLTKSTVTGDLLQANVLRIFDSPPWLLHHPKLDFSVLNFAQRSGTSTVAPFSVHTAWVLQWALWNLYRWGKNSITYWLCHIRLTVKYPPVDYYHPERVVFQCKTVWYSSCSFLHLYLRCTKSVDHHWQSRRITVHWWQVLGHPRLREQVRPPVLNSRKGWTRNSVYVGSRPLWYSWK